MPTQNNNKLVLWLLGVLASVVISISGAWAMSVSNKVDKIAPLEVKVTQQEKQLDRMELKIDKLMDKQGLSLDKKK